jgi:hypothetical protein
MARKKYLGDEPIALVKNDAKSLDNEVDDLVCQNVEKYDYRYDYICSCKGYS